LKSEKRLERGERTKNPEELKYLERALLQTTREPVESLRMSFRLGKKYG
jgi:hypothetical protein